MITGIFVKRVGREHGDGRGYADKVSEVKDFSSQAPEQLVSNKLPQTHRPYPGLSVRVVCSSLSSSKLLPPSRRWYMNGLSRWPWISGWLLACSFGDTTTTNRGGGALTQYVLHCVERVEPRGSIIDKISKGSNFFVKQTSRSLSLCTAVSKACIKCQWVNPCRDWTQGVSQEIFSTSILNETRNPQDCLRVCQMMM